MLSQTKNVVGGCQSALGPIRPVRPLFKSPIFNPFHGVKNLESFSVPSVTLLAAFHMVAKTQFCQTNPTRKISKPLQINVKPKSSASFWRKNEPKCPGNECRQVCLRKRLIESNCVYLRPVTPICVFFSEKKVF